MRSFSNKLDRAFKDPEYERKQLWHVKKATKKAARIVRKKILRAAYKKKPLSFFLLTEWDLGLRNFESVYNNSGLFIKLLNKELREGDFKPQIKIQPGMTYYMTHGCLWCSGSIPFTISGYLM